MRLAAVFASIENLTFFEGENEHRGGNEHAWVDDFCRTCGQCVCPCPTEAIQINASTGAKEISDGLCVGCKVCTIACPFGTVNYNESSGKVIKCDLCGGDPACATACPTQAITYVDAQWTGYDKMRAWAERTDNQATAQA